MITRKEKIKDLILKHRGFFSLDQIVAETHYPRPAVAGLLDALERDRFVTKSMKPSWIYRINRAEEGENLSVNRMWSVIRNKAKSDGFFTLYDLIILADTKRETARYFCKTLRRAGFIAPNKPSGKGVYWTLVKDPGPRRPYIGKKEV